MKLAAALLAVSVAGFMSQAWAGLSSEVPRAYRTVAMAYGVPAAILYAVAEAESGLALTSGRLRPWPWTLNVAGTAERHLTRQAAHDALERHLADGTRLIDIGLMQVNWRWNEEMLEDTWQALDPYFNLRIGARILRRHFDDTGCWVEAIGRYHAPAQTPEARRRAVGYSDRVLRHLTRIGWKVEAIQ